MKLYVVSTPIGNLADISFRAIEILKNVDLIFCEDTRVTRKLLSHYSINTPTTSYNSWSSFSKIRKALTLLKENKQIAIVSDAGTPGISDPGVKLIKKVRDEFKGKNIIEVIPGACAVVSSLASSGAPASSFLFLGFLPRKKGRKTIFEEIRDEARTVVFYESPHRLLKTLEALIDYVGNRDVIVSKEMTKIYEEHVSGSAKEVLDHFNSKNVIKGEYVIVISSLKNDDENNRI